MPAFTSSGSVYPHLHHQGQLHCVDQMRCRAWFLECLPGMCDSITQFNSLCMSVGIFYIQWQQSFMHIIWETTSAWPRVWDEELCQGTDLINRFSFLILFFPMLVEWVTWSSHAPLIHTLQHGVSQNSLAETLVFEVLLLYEINEWSHLCK